MAAICSLLLLLGWFYTSTVAAQSEGNNPRPMDDSPTGGISDRLAPPPISDPPTTVESGHYEYYLYCMVCHGDRGQGLTEEWRNAGDPADANCWQSRCHASNYPPGGFVLPRYAPPLIGDFALARFATIGDLHQYIQLSMPWHMPGALKDEQYRLIAIYLADANGAAGLNRGADWAEIATRLPTSRTVAPLPVATVGPVPVLETETPVSIWPALLIPGGVAVVGGIVWARRRRQKTENQITD